MLIPLSALFALLPLISAATCPAPRAVCNALLSSGYLSTVFTATKAQIDGYARRSIDSLLSHTNPATGEFKPGSGGYSWTDQNGWTAVAEYDRTRGTKVYAAKVSAAQDALAATTNNGVPLVNEFNDDSGWGALANLKAYEAYGDQKYLDRAIGVWNFLTGQIITQAVIDKGYLEGVKNPDNTIQAKCNGQTMVGGVYWVNGLPKSPGRAGDSGVNAVSTGLFALLSAELCKITKDTAKYCSKAYDAAQCLDRHLVRPDNGLLWDGVNGKTCEVTDWTFTYNAALYINTYALLSSLTSNTTALSLAERTAKASLSTTQWNADNGIIKEGAGDASGSDDAIGFKSVLIRALYRSYPWFKDEQLKAAIVQYVNIQYYAITQLDSDSPSQPVNYGRNWAGPKFEVSTQHAQLAALDVLNAITLNPKAAFLKTEKSGLPVIKTEKRATGC